MTSRARALLVALLALSLIGTETQSQESTPLQTATPTPAATGSPPLATETPSVTPAEETPTTATPVGDATATPASTPIVEPTAPPPSGPPTLGGNVEVLATDDSRGSEGDTVTSGRFAIENTTGADESITEVEIDASDPSLLASLTLEATLPDGSSQTSTHGDPGSTNTFRFDPGLTIPPGETVTFELRATIGEGGSASATVTPQATTTSIASGTATVTPEVTATSTASGTVTATPDVSPTSTVSSTATPAVTTTSTPTASPTETPALQGITRRGHNPMLLLAAAQPVSQPAEGRTGGPTLMLSTLFLAIAGPGFRYGRRLRTARALAWLIAVAFVAARSLTGCGLEDTTSQTLTAVRGSSASGPVFFSGVPASVGSVSRPTVLAFPGASSDADADPTATPTS